MIARALTLAAVLTLLVLLGVASVWTIQQNEEGVRLRFGRPVGTVGGGLHVTLPWPIETLVRVPTTEVRTVTIGAVGEAASAAGLGTPDDVAQWLTGDTNIVELRANVLYTVTDATTYVYGVSASDRIATHEALIRACCEAVVTRLLAATPIDSVLAAGKIEVASRGLRETQALLDGLAAGVRLTALDITEVTPPERVIRSFNDVSSAKADRERLLAEAEGIQGTVLPRARARAREIVQAAHVLANDLTSRARGEADSFRQLAVEVAKRPQLSRERLWLEGLERILRNVDERVVPPGSRVYIGR